MITSKIKDMSRQFVNPRHVVLAYIQEPYKNSGDAFDHYPSHGWRVALTVGFDGQYPITVYSEHESEQECADLLAPLGLIETK